MRHKKKLTWPINIVSHKIVMIDSIENKRTTNPWGKQKNMK